MQLVINLEYPFSSFKWFRNKEGIYVIGRAFLNDKIKENKSLAAWFSNIEDRNDFEKRLQSLNGNFAVVINTPKFKAAAVDHIRYFPLLYKQVDSSLLITDCVEQFDRDNWNERQSTYLKYFWCTLGNETLKKGVSQLQGGEYLWIEGETSIIYSYFKHQTKIKFDSTNVLLKDLNKITLKAFERWYSLIGNRQILVPLSGGYDSRLLLSILKEYGFTNVLAYTYGKENSFEKRIAQKVARKLDFQWTFIEYNESAFSHFGANRWQEYAFKNHFYTSLPLEQEFFALNELTKKDKLEQNFIAIPGYCGDLLGGSLLKTNVKDFSETALNNFIAQNFGFKKQNDEYFIKRKSIDEFNFFEAYQNWFVLNKVSKFIVNGTRVFEFFGGDFLLPFWDLDLIRFWYSISNDERYGQKLYNKYLFDFHFNKYKIDFSKDRRDINTSASKIKSRLKKILPNEMVHTIKKARKVDVNNFSLLRKQIIEKIESDINAQEFPDVNNVHAIYLLQSLKALS